MKLNFCVVCGSKDDLHQHHIEPIVYSNKKRNKSRKVLDINKPLKECSTFEIFAYLFDEGFISEDDTITVCSYHHNLLHGVMKYQKIQHTELIKEGQKKAREKGVKFGRPSRITPILIDQVKEMRRNGIGIRRIAKNIGGGVGTVYKCIGSNHSGKKPLDP